MSNPPNILADYNTYAYHHTLIAADGYNTAALFNETVDPQAFERAPGNNKFDVQYLNNNLKNGYVVLIDSRTDMGLSLKSIKWNSLITPMDASDTLEVDGEMTVVEPYGFRFYEVLANAARDLGKDPAGLVYVLKTTFVSSSHATAPVVANVRPFNFLMTDLSSTIDQMGSEYSVKFVGVSNGMAKLPQHAMMAQGINLEVETGDTVGSMMNKLEIAVQDKYREHVDTLQAQLKKINPELFATDQAFSDRFQEIEYTFAADEVYYDGIYEAGNNSNPMSDGGDGKKYISAGMHDTVEDLMRKIIQSSIQCADDGAAKNSEGAYYIHNIVSFPVETNNDNLGLRHEIHRFQISTQDPNAEVLEPQPGEYIEFDYIYTGKNVDILEFDMNMAFGFTFLQTLATTPTLPLEQAASARGDQKTGEPGAGSGVDANINKALNLGNTKAAKTVKSPIYMGTKETDPFIRNQFDPLSASTFKATLARWASLEALQATVKIAGNPNLLDEIIDTSGREAKTPVAGSTGAVDVTRTPALAKINVKFPDENDPKFGVSDFWYKGLYRIFAIQNSFDDGLFTQTLQLLSIPLFEENDIDKAEKAETTFTQSATVVASVPVEECEINEYPYDLIPGFKASGLGDDIDFMEELDALALAFGTQPEWLLANMSWKSGLVPTYSAPNSGDAGLWAIDAVQAAFLGKTFPQIQATSPAEQLVFVQQLLVDLAVETNLNTMERLVSADIFLDAESGHPDFVISLSGELGYPPYAQFDVLPTIGELTLGELTSPIAAQLVGGITAVQKKLKKDTNVTSALAGPQLAQLVSGSFDPLTAYAIQQYVAGSGIEVRSDTYITDELLRSLFNIPESESKTCTITDQYKGTAITPDPSKPGAPLNQHNNNPTNIRAGAEWKGKVGVNKGFVQFKDPQHGIRAATIIIRGAYHKRGDNTVARIIGKWAPIGDNSVEKTGNYINFVAGRLGVSTNQRLNVKTNDDQLIQLFQAMNQWEGGPTVDQLPVSVYREGIALATR